MLKSVGWFAAGAVVATAAVTRLIPANTSTCCQRVAYGARTVIAERTGPFASVTAWTLDALGLTKHIPSLLDRLGVPLDF